MADTSICATSLLGVVVRHVICGFYLFIFSSKLCCPLRFQNSPQTHCWEGFLVVGNFFFFTTPSLGRVSIPHSFVSLFIFYILSYLHSKTMGCLCARLVSSTSVQKLFCGIFSAFKCSFSEFVGEKVVSLSYSSAILGLPTILICVFFFDTTQNLTQGGFLKTSCNMQSESHRWSFCSLLNWKFIDLSCTLALLHVCDFVMSFIGKQRYVSYRYFYTIKKYMLLSPSIP